MAGRIMKGLCLLAVLAGLVAVGCGTVGKTPPRSEFEREFQRYLSLPHQKAFAVAGSEEARFVFGYGYAWSAPGLAKDAALEQCNVRRRSLGEDAQCRIYAVGNQVLPGEVGASGAD